MMGESPVETSQPSESTTVERSSAEAASGEDGIDDGLSYRIPANPEVMFPPDTGALNPPPETLARRTGNSAADLESLRRRALAEAWVQAAEECASTFQLPDR